MAAALSASGRRNQLVWFAAVAMAVGVALEIASEALATGAGELAGSGQTAGAIALDRGASYLAAGILAPSGVAILLTAWAMLRSGLFNPAVAVIGLLAGASVVAAGLASEPANAGLKDSLATGMIVSWVFMLWTGVALWRGRRR